VDKIPKNPKEWYKNDYKIIRLTVMLWAIRMINEIKEDINKCLHELQENTNKQN
jgi:hypothetical protein